MRRSGRTCCAADRADRDPRRIPRRARGSWAGQPIRRATQARTAPQATVDRPTADRPTASVAETPAGAARADPGDAPPALTILELREVAGPDPAVVQG